VIKKRHLILPVLLALLGAAQAADTSSAARQRLGDDEALWTRLQKGEAVLLPSKFRAKGFRDNRATSAAILINSSAKPIWQVVSDKESAPEYMSGLLRSEVVKKASDHMIVEAEMKIGRLPGTFTYLMRHQTRTNESITFKFISGDVRDIQGAWELLPAGEGKTVLLYSLWLDPGFYVPQGFVQKSLRSGVPNAVRAVRDRVKSVYAVR